jgi:hypothetical protein
MLNKTDSSELKKIEVHKSNDNEKTNSLDFLLEKDKLQTLSDKKLDKD